MSYKTSEFNQPLRCFYTLMNKDKEVRTILFEYRTEIQEYVASFIEIPNTIEALHRNATNFLRERKTSHSREYISDLLDLRGMHDLKTYVDISYALSLNDTLWVKPADSEVTWAKINLYDNRFNNSITAFAFTGKGVEEVAFDSPSPEYSTNGMLAKCWKRYDDEIALLKNGTHGYSNAGKEPYSEYYTCQLLAAMGIRDYIGYDLVKYRGRVASKCRLFTNQEYGFRSAIGEMNRRNESLPAQLFMAMGLLKEFQDIIFIDSLICNSDRHLNNFGVIINNNTLEVEGMAPIFDNGLALVPYWTTRQDIIEYSGKETGHSLYGHFIEEGRKLRNKERLCWAKNLIDFKFTKHPLYNLDDERLGQLERLIQHNVQQILKP